MGFDIDNSEERKRNLALTKKQQKYLHPEYPSQDSTTNEDGVAHTLENFPRRLEDLFKDVALLATDNRFKENTWTDYIQTEKFANKSYRSEISVHTGGKIYGEQNLGFELGSIFREIYTQSNKEFNPGRDLSYIAWGFMLGLFAEENEEATIRNLTGMVEKLKNFKDSRETQNEYERKLIDLIQQNEKEKSDDIHKTVQQGGIEPSDDLVSEIRQFHFTTSHEDIITFTEKITNNSEFQRVNKLLNEVKLDVEKLEKDNLDSDMKGAETKEVLKELYQSEYGLLASTIATKIGLSTGAHSPVTGILFRLTSNIDKETWTSHDVVIKSNNRWKLTPYGKLVCLILFEDNREWMVSSLPLYYVFAQNEDDPISVGEISFSATVTEALKQTQTGQQDSE